MVKKYVSSSRIATVFKRQKSPPWGVDYLPGILATKEEAPVLSRASILTPGSLRRQVHCLSEPEKYFAIFGFYSQRFFSLQEQRMMPAHPTPHPLSTIKKLESGGLPCLPGIAAIAEQIGATRILKVGSFSASGGDVTDCQIVLPFFSDFLWAVIDTNSRRIGCLNWNIKDHEEGFRRSIGTRKPRHVNDEEVIARQTLERLYYQIGGIQTINLSLDQLDVTLRENLLRLFLHHRRRVQLKEDIRFELSERFKTALQAGIPINDVIVDARRHAIFELEDARTLIWQMIWKRDLRVDLFSNLVIDRPLKPEEVDPLEHYSSWFEA